jgi:hypothetical protein
MSADVSIGMLFLVGNLLLTLSMFVTWHVSWVLRRFGWHAPLRRQGIAFAAMAIPLVALATLDAQGVPELWAALAWLAFLQTVWLAIDLHHEGSGRPIRPSLIAFYDKTGLAWVVAILLSLRWLRHRLARAKAQDAGPMD